MSRLLNTILRSPVAHGTLLALVLIAGVLRAATTWLTQPTPADGFDAFRFYGQPTAALVLIVPAWLLTRPEPNNSAPTRS